MPEITGSVARCVKGSLGLINLTDLPAEKKQQAWELIQTENPALAQLLQSADFDRVKTMLEQSFGAIKVLVEPTQIGGSEYGIRSRIKEQN